MAKIVANITGRRPPLLNLPIWLARIGVPFAKVLSFLNKKPSRFTHDSLDTLAKGSSQLSWEKAEMELGFHPQPLEKTLRIAYDHFEQLGML